jgi:hypothetical protein
LAGPLFVGYKQKVNYHMAVPLFGSLNKRYRVQEHKANSQSWQTIKTFGTLELARQFAQTIPQHPALRRLRILDQVTERVYEIPSK